MANKSEARRVMREFLAWLPPQVLYAAPVELLVDEWLDAKHPEEPDESARVMVYEGRNKRAYVCRGPLPQAALDAASLHDEGQADEPSEIVVMRGRGRDGFILRSVRFNPNDDDRGLFIVGLAYNASPLLAVPINEVRYSADDRSSFLCAFQPGDSLIRRKGVTTIVRNKSVVAESKTKKRGRSVWQKGAK